MQSQIEQLLEQIELFNSAYRAGSPLVSDAEYDSLVSQLADLDPENEWLRRVEPEPTSGKKTLRLPEPMLSTQKAYDVETLRRWYDNAVSVCGHPGLIHVTPKLDGFAAIRWRQDGVFKMATRGDGLVGQDISRFADRTPCFLGKGEIVINKLYFERYLSSKYENPRNVIAAAIKESQPEPAIAKAISGGAIVFMPFGSLYREVYYGIEALLDSLDSVWAVAEQSAYQTDGLVLEFADPKVKEKLGSTSHHHRWQIAYKRNTEFHRVKVTGHEWQTSRNGRVTPVVLIEPTRISGVTVSRVTGHHATNVYENGIGVGAEVEVTRSGQVIPYIAKVIRKSPVDLPRHCKSCGGAINFIDGNHLGCTNTLTCPAQRAGKIEHFFKTIGCDGFGAAVCELLKGDSIADILDMTPRAFTDRGISSGVANNLSEEIDARTAAPIEDWRLLAAFGLPGVGEVNCRKLMQNLSLEDIFKASEERIASLDGFGKVLSAAINNSLYEIRHEFADVREFFKITQTKAEVKKPGITVVFTGTMNYPRTTMEEDAREKGWNVASSVSSKTTYLVCGDNVGANKMDAAKKKGVKVITESEYWALLRE